MALMEIAPARRARPPKSDHRPSIAADPEEYDIARWITIGKVQKHHINIKALRFFGAFNRQMCFVKVHVQIRSQWAELLPIQSPREKKRSDAPRSSAYRTVSKILVTCNRIVGSFHHPWAY